MGISPRRMAVKEDSTIIMNTTPLAPSSTEPGKNTKCTSPVTSAVTAIVHTMVPLLVWIAAAILLLPHVERRLSPARLGILLVLTGGLSNQYDRMRRGSVTDYVQLPRAGKRLGRLVWNVADFMLLGGVVLTVIGVIREMLKG